LDVIAVLQAGFIGTWGEWHSSTNDLVATLRLKNEGFAAAINPRYAIRLANENVWNEIEGAIVIATP